MMVRRMVLWNLFGSLLLTSIHVLGQDNKDWKPAPSAIITRWTKDVSPNNALPEYPRPQMVRESWQNLNGLWDYVITEEKSRQPSIYAGKILVPYPVESVLSGVNKPLYPSQVLWYRRNFVSPVLKPGQRLLLHFGAVDWEATVYVNGKETGKHAGGYMPFTQDITEAVKEGANEIVVKVYDPTNIGVGPHGKQILNPSSIYYTPSSGIWQTVWLETVEQDYIHGLTLIPDIDRGVLVVSVKAPGDAIVEITAKDHGKPVGSIKGRALQPLFLSIKHPKLWSPSEPHLYDLTVSLVKGGRKTDEIQSYFGMRKIAIQKDSKGIDRIFLNNRPYFNIGTLDQGFWPDGLYTAPTDDALKFDIEAVKGMGFNTIRKHIKIEPARWYYHADKIGILVWQDFVNPNQSLPEGAKAAFEKDVKETIEQLQNVPSITTWVVFNEKWGVFDQKRITEFVKHSDSTRIVNGHSGEMLYVNNELRSPSPNPWVSSDMTDVHSYPYPMNAPQQTGKARALGEFGGIGVPVEGHLWDDLVAGWGYQGIGTVNTLKVEYERMTDSLLVLKKDGLSASIYTQPYDVESEQNGLLTYDRELIKLPIELLRSLNNRLADDGGSEAPRVKVAISTLNENIVPYSERKRLLDAGQVDSIFLRRFAIMSLRERDTLYLNKAMASYIGGIQDPYASSNIRLIAASAITPDGRSCQFISSHRDSVNQFLGKNAAEAIVMTAIFQTEIKPYLNSNMVSWQDIENKVISHYGELGKEKLVSAKLAYYLEKKDWLNYGKYYKLYYDKALTTGRNEFHINNLSWYVFDHVNDTAVLAVAVKAMKYNLEKFEPNHPGSIDTYANLLYKIGRKEEAIKWQKKAVELSNNGKEFMQTYTKMVNNEKTWK